MSVIKFNRNFSTLFNWDTDSNPTTEQDYQSAVKNWTETEMNLVDILLWQPTTEYDEGNIAKTPSLPSQYVLVCTTAGISGSTEPDYTNVQLGDNVTDGSVTWNVSQLAIGAVPVITDRAMANASNVGVNAETDNSEAWGDAIGGGAIASGEKRLINGNTAYALLERIVTSENNIATNTENIEHNTENIAANATAITALTADVEENTADIEQNAQSITELTTSVETNTTNIATNTANIATNAENIATNTEDIANNTTDIEVADKRISNIEKLLQGNLYDYQTDTDSAYTKTVPAGAMPYAGIEKLGGKTLVWNQMLVNESWSVTKDGVTTAVDAENHLVTITNNEQTANYSIGSTQVALMAQNATIVGHKYLFTCDAPSMAGICLYRDGSILFGDFNTVLTLDVPAQYIRLRLTNNYDFVTEHPVGDTYSFHVNIYDLTLMFGSGNEPTTVAEFTAQFPASYYPYNAGTLLSAGVTEVVSNGKNLLPNTLPSNTINATIASGGAINSATNARVFAIPCEPNTDYMLSQKVTPSTWGRVGFANVLPAIGNTIDDKGSMANRLAFSINSGNNHYMIMQFSSEADFISNVNSNEPMIEVGTAKTNYAPYKAPIQYPIPAEIRNLEGYGWSAGQVYNYIDFERKVLVKKVERIKIGNIAWQYNPTYRTFWIRENALTLPMKSQTTTRAANITCSKYVTTTATNITSKDNIILADAAYLSIVDTSFNGNINDFKTNMGEGDIFYELATPIETDISQYLTDDNLIEVEPNGTLTFPNSNGTDYQIPVPSEETYMINLQEAVSNG